MKNIIKGSFTLIAVLFVAGAIVSCFLDDRDDDKYMVIACAKAAIQEKLISPSSAKFPWGADEWIISQDGDAYEVIVDFESENYYGVLLKQTATVRFRFLEENEDGDWRYVVDAVDIVDVNSAINSKEETTRAVKNDYQVDDSEYSRKLSRAEKLEILRYIYVREAEIGEENYTEEKAEKLWRKAEKKFNIVQYDIQLLMLDTNLVHEVYSQGLY